MKQYLIIFSLLSSLALLGSCRNNGMEFDATGTFEATEIIVSSEATGRIISFDAKEGTSLKKGQEVVRIEPTSLELQKAQLEASIGALKDKQNDPGPQIAVLNEQLEAANTQLKTLQTQLRVLTREKERVGQLYKAEAATEKQFDEINGQVDVMQDQIKSAESQIEIIKSQINSTSRSVAIQNRAITSEKDPLEKRVDQLDDQLSRTQNKSPVDGTLLVKYAESGEFTAIGKPLYKMADLSEMVLRAYITGTQLPLVKTGQKVEVYIDDVDGNYKMYPGTISWIASSAEFTPKTIQTKDERANLVYAIKIRVPNDGGLKIGMYGEVKLSAEKKQDE